MGLVLDTSAYIAFVDNQPGVVRATRLVDIIFMPVVVIGELRYGYHKGSRSLENSRQLSSFLNNQRVEIAVVDDAVAKQYGLLKYQQARIGKILTDNDLWIASICLSLHQPLLSLDTDFNRIEQLELLPLE